MGQKMERRDLDAARTLLGVVDSDGPAEVRRAWLKLVRAYHPDKFRGDKAAANCKLAEINAAFDLIEIHLTQNARAQSRVSEPKTGKNVVVAQSEQRNQNRRCSRRTGPPPGHCR